MKSIFQPETSCGRRFFGTAYAIVAKKLKIDPVAEGALLRKRTERLFWGSDIIKLKDPKEREKRLTLANKFADVYAQRWKKFMRAFYYYCYARGQLRAVRTLEAFVPDAEQREEKLDAKKQHALEESSD